MTEGYVLARPVVRPAVSAGWAAWPTPGDDATLLLSGTGAERSWSALPARPVLRTRPDGTPVFTLTVVLSRRPDPSRDQVLDLVEFATLGLELSLLPDGATLRAAGNSVRGDVRLVNATGTSAALRTSGQEWATVTGASLAGALAMTTTLPRAEALDALAALDGSPSRLTATTTVRYRTPVTLSQVRLQGSWAIVHERLSAVASPTGEITTEAVRAVLAELLTDGTVTVTVNGEPVLGGLEPPRSGAVVTAWLRTISTVLQRVPTTTGSDGYVLRDRPPDTTLLDVGFSEQVGGADQVELSTPLDRLLRGALEGRDQDEFVHLVVVDPAAPTGFAAVERRVRSPRPRGGDPSTPLALFEGRVRGFPLLLTPDSTLRVPATARMLDVLSRRPLSQRLGVRRWALDDVVLDPVVLDGDPRVPLPVVDDAAAGCWPDRLDPNRLWYAPHYELLPYATDVDPAQSGFLMTFANSGVTAAGQSSLTGRVRFRLQAVVPERATAAAAGDPSRLQPVDTTNLAVTLQIPFRDTTTHQTLEQSFAATLSSEGEVLVADVDLLDTWVRLTYGALARPGFQEHPAQLRVTYSYSGYVPTGEIAVMAFGGKQLVESASLLRTRRRPDGFELPDRPDPIRIPGPEDPVPVWHGPVVVDDGPVLVPPVRRPDHVVRSLVEDQARSALFPCADVGGLYRQQTAEGEVVVGCQDALTLGEVRYRQFEELLDLRPRFGTVCRVYRSLQQPGSFLVVPARYRISRYGPDEAGDRPYRPVVFVYAVLGGTATENRYRISATLQPDLAADVRAELQQRLVAFSPHGSTPVTVLPTDPAVGADAEFDWAVALTDDVPVVQRVWDTLQVTISTGFENALLVTRMIEGSGYTGSVRFTLPDGLVVDAGLLLDSAPCGPWATGPVTADLDGSTVTLTNHVERAVSVPELLTLRGDLGTVPVGTTLAPGATTTIEVPAGVTGAWPRTVPDDAPSTIQEMRVFVEDVLVELQLLDALDHAAHDLTGLHVEVSLAGRAEVVARAELTERSTTTLQITLPVTNYLQSGALTLQFTRRTVDGTSTPSAVVAWNLPVQGNVITVDWALVQ